jgi:indolepyruvate ferredoxin oxidoreductase, alpha subunit
VEKLATLSIKSDAPGAKLFMLGNEAIARGAVEAGVQVMAAYPGTPSTEIAETLINIAKDFGIDAQWSVNEKVAFGVAMGAAMCGLRSMSVMKHVGLNVAADLVMTAAYMGTTAGLVLVEAEDPGQWSSSDEQDNRFLAEEAYLPILEPSSAQEAKDMTRDAFRLSEEFQQPFVVRSVTRTGHARGDVTLGEISPSKRTASFEKDINKWVQLPAIARTQRRKMVARLAKIKEAVNTLPYNHLRIVEGANLGIITSGISYAYTMDALSMLGIADKVSVLKVGTPYPLPEKLVTQLLGAVSSILIVEELEAYVENHVKAIGQEAGICTKVHGKDYLPVAGELSTRKVAEVIAKLTETPLPIDFNNIDNLVQETISMLPLRPPSLCAGCPHRASHYAIKVAGRHIKRETGIEPVYPGDIGCYCLGANEPLNAVDTSTCMGSGFDLANGMARALKAPIVAHLGDSTFFHSGIPPLINAVFNKTRAVFVILDNSATSMTGFQPHPGAPGAGQEPVKIEDVARACGVKFVEVVNCYDLKKTIDVFERAMRFDGPSVVVSRGLCAILTQRERRQKGAKAVPYTVDLETCTDCRLCVNSLGCPAIVIEDKHVSIDASQCDGCGLCAQVCPTQSIVKQ